MTLIPTLQPGHMLRQTLPAQGWNSATPTDLLCPHLGRALTEKVVLTHFRQPRLPNSLSRVPDRGRCFDPPSVASMSLGNEGEIRGGHDRGVGDGADWRRAGGGDIKTGYLVATATPANTQRRGCGPGFNEVPLGLSSSWNV